MDCSDPPQMMFAARCSQFPTSFQDEKRRIAQTAGYTVVEIFTFHLVVATQPVTVMTHGDHPA